MSSTAVTFSTHGGTLSASSNNTAVASVAKNSNSQITISGGRSAGSCTVTASVAATTNYTAKSNTISVSASAPNCQCNQCSQCSQCGECRQCRNCDCDCYSCSCSCSCSCGGGD